MKFFLGWGDNPELQGLPKKFCNTFYTSVKINRKWLQFFLWLILNIPLASEMLWNKFSCTCEEGCQNGVVW
jgi:hypothetical protein